MNTVETASTPTPPLIAGGCHFRQDKSNSGQAPSAYNVKIAIMFFKLKFLWHTRSADHDIDWLICDDMRNKSSILCMLIPLLGCIKSHCGSWLHRTATHLTDMFYLQTDVAVCKIEEVVLELHTCLLVYIVTCSFINVRVPLRNPLRANWWTKSDSSLLNNYLFPFQWITVLSTLLWIRQPKKQAYFLLSLLSRIFLVTCTK